MKKLDLLKITDFIFKIIVAIYVGIVVYFYCFDTVRYAWIIPFLVVGIYFLVGYFLYKAPDVQQKEKVPPQPALKFMIVAFSIILLGQLTYWLAYYPGGFNLDAYGQWDQVHGKMQWNNWHPVLTTALYWLLTRICDSLAFCILIQIIGFSFVTTCLLGELYKGRALKKLLWLAAFFIGWNPAVATNNICLIKDCPFTIVAMCLFWCFIKIVKSKGKWLSSTKGIVILTGIIVAGMLIRHNAVFLTIPLLVCVCLSYRKQLKSILKILISSILVVIVIEGPFFSALNVEQHSNVTGEMVGVPMAAMANALVNDAKNVPQDVETFLLQIADRKDWEARYYVGEWDSCKWEFGGIELLKGESMRRVLNLFIQTLKSCPDAVYQSFRENTRVVWQIFGNAPWDTWIYIENNDYGIKDAHVETCYWFVSGILTWSHTAIGSLITWNVGFEIIVYLFLLLISIKTKQIRKTGMIIALLAYDFFTMLLLCGPSYRYFYMNLVILIPMIAFMYEPHDM